MMEEIWKDIKGFEGRYQVSNLGRVRSLDWPRHKGRILKQQITYWGYYRVNIVRECGGVKYIGVHRLVAIAFIPNPNNYPEVNHKDENKLNNMVFINPDGSIDYEKTNLEWCTTQYNLSYGTRNERFQKKANEPRMRSINQYDMDGNLINTFKSISEASRMTGTPARLICNICKKRNAHSTRSFVFRYSDDKSPWIDLDADKCRGNKERMRAVLQYDLKGNLIGTYESVNEASRKTGVSRRWIQGLCNQRKGHKSAHGYIFRYMK